MVIKWEKAAVILISLTLGISVVGTNVSAQKYQLSNADETSETNLTEPSEKTAETPEPKPGNTSAALSENETPDPPEDVYTEPKMTDIPAETEVKQETAETETKENNPQPETGQDLPKPEVKNEAEDTLNTQTELEEVPLQTETDTPLKDPVPEIPSGEKELVDTEDVSMITRFAFSEASEIMLDEKLPVSSLGLPEQLLVYLNSSSEPELISVTWRCEDDYENTDYDQYVFHPIWDEAQFPLDPEADVSSIPVITVILRLPAMNSLQRSAETEMYTISNGAITGLTQGYLDSLSADEKQNLSLSIPAEVNGIPVTSIASQAFNFAYTDSEHKKYANCRIVALDFSEAVNLETIGSYAFANNMSVTSSVSFPDSLTTIQNYAFSSCSIRGTLILPQNLNKIGDSAFRMSSAGSYLTGELVIPASVTTMGKVAFSGQQGITGVRFEGDQLTSLPDSVFRYCSGISGVLRIPDSITQIGGNTFSATQLTTVYLPKGITLSSSSFSSSPALTAIVCDKDDYNSLFGTLSSSDKKKLGYEMTVRFDTQGNGAYEAINRLYNHAYNLEKDADGTWRITSYQFPKVTNKAWGLTADSVQPVQESNLITQEVLYLINGLENPVITYSPHQDTGFDIDQVYDGKSITLTVNATHPLAKKLSESKDGDVIFNYTWRWLTIGSSGNVLSGFDKNQYTFTDVREPRFAISCQVVVQACVRSGSKAKVFYTETHDFSILLQQAESTVTPVLNRELISVGSDLPEISLSEGDTEGTIAWDENQTVQEGVHDYVWTFTPIKNEAGGYNYKTVKGTETLTGVNGEIYYIETVSGGHGSISPSGKTAAAQGSSLPIQLIPETGYKLATLTRNGEDILSQVIQGQLILDNVQADCRIEASFEKIKAADVEDEIHNLPDISGPIGDSEIDQILDAKVNESVLDSEAISEAAKEKLNEALAQLPQIEVGLDKEASLADKSALMETVEGQDAAALIKDKTASLKIEIMVDDSKTDEQEQSALKAALQETMIVKSYDVSVIKTLTDSLNTEKKKISKLKTPILLVFDVPKELSAPAAGTQWKFSIARAHTAEGKTTVEILEDQDNNPETITIKSDKFSTYAIIVEPVKTAQVTVRFETNGGTPVDSAAIQAGTLLEEPEKPVKKGYDFIGWFTDPQCTQRWDFTKHKADSDFTLYAGWRAIQSEPAEATRFTVYFDTQGGNVIDAVTAVQGEAILKPANPTRSGYRFTGWYKDKNARILWNFDLDRVTGDLTLYAGWKKLTVKDTVTVRFETNSDLRMDAVVVKIGELITRPENPERLGYTFTGWYKDLEQTNLWDFEKDQAENDLTLYAGWKEETSQADQTPKKSDEVKPEMTEKPQSEKTQAERAADLLPLLIAALIVLVGLTVTAGTLLVRGRKRKH